MYRYGTVWQQAKHVPYLPTVILSSTPTYCTYVWRPSANAEKTAAGGRRPGGQEEGRRREQKKAGGAVRRPRVRPLGRYSTVRTYCTGTGVEPFCTRVLNQAFVGFIYRTTVRCYATGTRDAKHLSVSLLFYSSLNWQFIAWKPCLFVSSPQFTW